MDIKIKLLTDTAKHPQRMSDAASGYDIFSDNGEDIVIKPTERTLIPTGFALAIPKGMEAQIRPRSGLAVKHGITVLNSPGTIDADYRGEVKVILINLSKEDFVVNKGMRIAQMVFAEHKIAEFDVVSELDETQRGSGGFGHSDRDKE